MNLFVNTTSDDAKVKEFMAALAIQDTLKVIAGAPTAALIRFWKSLPLAVCQHINRAARHFERIRLE